MLPKVHVKIADRGWILEKCAKEISHFSHKISYSENIDPFADIQYYINYSARTRRVSPFEVAFFTHSEFDEGARRRYFDTAAEVDHCVCMSARYAQELIEHGISADKISVIAPGVDLKAFRPKVRIGVVGRTYHTGRKGEALVAQVMDVPGIEWCFTGAGWPGPSTPVPEGGMPDFYNSLDYVLVPALYEGGPMSVLEGLACGVPIITSDVGWAFEYPHIPFETGDAQSLRGVLEKLVRERETLRETVLPRSWDAWANAHLDLFRRVIGNAPVSVGSAEPGAQQWTASASLVLHGNEGKALGGPTVRVPRTASELARIGFNASLAQENPHNHDDHPVAHIFNLWPGASCFNALDRARAAGKRTVLSPIFLNLTHLQTAAKTIPGLFAKGHSDLVIDVALREIARQVDEEPNLPLREPTPGYYNQVRSCIAAADEVIFLSEYEKECLAYLGAQPKSGTVIHNPVDAEKFASADPELFTRLYGLDDYILCVGRIEARKNQLVLAHAARTLKRKVVFIGHSQVPAYRDLVVQAAGDYGIFIPRIDPADPMLASAIAGASVFCLPSWAEGAPLAALEAAAAGTPLVLSDRSSEREYFGDFAEYVNPADIDGLRTALKKAADGRDDIARREALKAHVRAKFSWEQYARKTAEVYEKASSSTGPVGSPQDTADEHEVIYFDLTTTFHASGHPTGIARVEGNVLEGLMAQLGARLVPIVWSSRTKSYLRLSHAQSLIRPTLIELEGMEKRGEVSTVAERGDKGGRIIVVGGAWIRNVEYISALQTLKTELGATLSVLVHDLIQMKLAHLYPDGVGAEFERNARLMTRAADNFLTYSDCSQKDLLALLQASDQFYKPISRFRLGDMTSLHDAVQAEEADALPASPLQAQFAGKTFAIFVSSIEIRKNHALLVNVWRRLVEERGSAAPHLLFIGRTFWRGDEVVEALRRESKLQPFVHVLNDVDDRDLDWFYRNCRFTLFPSLYEGWGLPVAESLSYGKLCITSSVTATREVAPSLTDLVDPYDFKGWRDRIAFYLDNPAALQRAEERIRAEYKVHPWSRSVEEILAAVTAAPRSPNFAEAVFPGQVIDFTALGSNASALAICGLGWGHPERGGRWSIGEASKLRFRFPTTAKSCHVSLQLSTLVPPGDAARQFTLVVNGTDVTTLEIAPYMQVLDLEVPVATDGTTEIAFRPEVLLSPSQIVDSPDTRLLGIYLNRAAFAEDPESLPYLDCPPPPLPPEPAVAEPSMAVVTELDPRLKLARDQFTFPPRFVGQRPILRVARWLGLDWIWLRYHQRKYRRIYRSLDFLIGYLENKRH